LSYEKVCILFNVAALQSAVAAGQSIENDDALKLAAKLFPSMLIQTSPFFFYSMELFIAIIWNLQSLEIYCNVNNTARPYT
jgi:hypothetical protein